MKSFPAPVLHLPCIQSRKIPGSFKRLEDFAASFAVFTSQKAVHFAYKHEELGPLLKTLRIFCFGLKTWEAVQKCGLQGEYLEGIRTAEALAGVLEKKIARGTKVLLPGPVKRVFDLEAHLIRNGICAGSVDLYETLPTLELGELEKSELISELNGVLCFASPSACEAFVGCLKPQSNRLHHLKTLALGPSTARICRAFFSSVEMSPENSLEKMVNRARDFFKP